jgi:hypothetical protein
LKLAVAVLAMAPLPLLATNALFIKLHPRITVAHALGWLVRLVVCALVVTLYGGQANGKIRLEARYTGVTKTYACIWRSARVIQRLQTRVT